MTFRIFSLPAVALGLMLSFVGAAHAESTKPNILWIVAEDMCPDLGCYGEPQVHTPHLDALAARGVLFTRAFATATVCSATRSAFITGVYQTTLGAQHQRMDDSIAPPLCDPHQTLPQRLREAGYYTANVKKINQHLRGTGKNDWNFTTKTGHFEGNDWAELKTRQPFFAQVNFQESHRPFTSESHADPAKVNLPPYYPDHPLARRDWAGYLDEITEVDVKVGKLLDQLEADGLADNTLVIFFGDHGRPMLRGKQWNYDSGTRVPLIIAWPKAVKAPGRYRSGSVSDQLVSLIDVTATSLKAAGVDIPESMHGRSIFDDEPRDAVFSASDRDGECILRSRSIRTDRYRYIRNAYPDRPVIYSTAYRQQMHPLYHLVRKLGDEGRLNAVQHHLLEPRGVEELYDLESDPYEIHNLADSPEHAEVLRDLRARLDAWIKRTNDQGQQPDRAEVAEYFEQYGRQSAKRRAKAIETMRQRVYAEDERFLREKQ